MSEKSLGKAFRYSSYLTSGKVKLRLEEYTILSYTPKGYWILIWGEEKKFILKDSLRGFAKLTKEEAFKSFQARKRRQIKLCQNAIEMAKKSLLLSMETIEVPYELTLTLDLGKP